VTIWEGPLPERMYRKGRPIVHNFAPDECLYYRIVGSDLSQLAGSGILFRFPDFSTNRGSLSEPEDVLLPHWLQCGIISFEVAAILLGYCLNPAEGPRYTFAVAHAPDDANYAHSEVKCFKDGVHTRDANYPPKTIRKHFRQILSERSQIIRQPEQ
jgi:hypothetical protein